MFPIELDEFSEDIPINVLKLWELVAGYCEREQWEDALTLSKIALKEVENDRGSDSRDVGLILSIVGFINEKIGKYDDAESPWERAILILEKNDQDLQFTLEIIKGLAVLFTKNERWVEAELIVKKAISIWEKLNEIDVDELVDLKTLMGLICLELKKPDEAKGFLWAALPVYVGKFGIDSVEAVNIFRLLEIAYFWRDCILESESFLENSNEIADVTSLCLLAMLYEDRNLPSKAVDYYQRAVEIHETKGSPDNSQLADISLKLSKCYLKIGNYLESQIYLDKSRAIYRKTLDADDPVMFDVNVHLSLCYVRLNKSDEARKIYEEIVGNIYTDESGLPILKLAEDYEESGEEKLPILKGKFNIIDCAMKNLNALYALDGEYIAVKTLEKLGKSEQDLYEEDEI